MQKGVDATFVSGGLVGIRLTWTSSIDWSDGFTPKGPKPIASKGDKTHERLLAPLFDWHLCLLFSVFYSSVPATAKK
jgi:hypothetical protein